MGCTHSWWIEKRNPPCGIFEIKDTDNGTLGTHAFLFFTTNTHFRNILLPFYCEMF